MNCIKCGRELSDGQVFCCNCQETMDLYPVKPGTPVQLPAHPASPESKPKAVRARKVLPPEVRIRKLHTAVRLLALALTAVLLAFAVTALLALHLLDQRDQQSPFSENYHITSES